MKSFLSLVLALSMFLMVSVGSAEPIGVAGQLIAANPDSESWSTEDAMSILQQEFERGEMIAINLSFEQQVEASQLWYDLLSLRNILFTNYNDLIAGKSSKAINAVLKSQSSALAAAEKAFFASVDKKNVKKFVATRDDWLDLMEISIQAYHIATTRLGITIPDNKVYKLSPRWDVY